MDPPSKPNPTLPEVDVAPDVAPSAEKVEVAPQGDEDAVSKVERKSRQLDRTQALLLGLLMLTLIGGAAWWELSRQSGGPVSGPVPPSDLPKDLVALINSSTPIPLRVPTGAKEQPANLGDAPQEDGWTPALWEAHRALEEGRYTSAISQYSALVGSGAGGAAGEAHTALWGLAETYAASGQPDLAMRAYTIFAGLDDPRALHALYRLAMLNERTGRAAEAARLYGEYAAHAGPARHAAMLSQARLLGRTQGAEDLYNVVIKDSPLDIDHRLALAGLADVKSQRGDHKGAADVYAQLSTLQSSQPHSLLDQDGLPAAVRAAEELAQVGDKAAAGKRLLDYIRDGCGGKAAACPLYPAGRFGALNALLKLEPSAVVSGTVAPMLAARISYDAGYYGRAINYMETLRGTSQDPAQRAAASLLTGKAFELSGDAASAFNWYTATVQTYPTAPEAPEAIRKAGDMLEAQSQWDAAMSVYREALARYPNTGRETALTRLHAGVLAYRLEGRDEALALLQPVLAMQPISPTLKAEGAFWAAKVQKSKGDVAWKSTIAGVSPLVPGTYLDFRTRSLIAGEPDGGPLTPTFQEGGTAAADLGIHFSNEAGEREELLAWAAELSPSRAAITATVTVTATVSSPRTASPQPGETARAMVLARLGDERASIALRALAQSLREAEDGRGLAELVLYARYHADTRTAMRVTEQLAIMDAAGDPLKRPRLLLKTQYPTPYSALVAQETQTRNIDPLVVYALMRQESQFVPGARSRADARGLTQVIPSTGEGIAEQLDDASFSPDDLFLPHVSVRYGAYYLASNLPQFDRKLLPTLAAYNGGPGNAARWLAGSALLDPDLYVERIDLFETEDYLGKVYTNYGFYRVAYAP